MEYAGNGKVIGNEQPSLMGHHHDGFGRDGDGIGRNLGFMDSHNRGIFMRQDLNNEH